jgi:hypothetical protein
MRFVALMAILLVGCRAPEPEPIPTREPTVREWLENSDAGREVLKSGEPLRFSDWE